MTSPNSNHSLPLDLICTEEDTQVRVQCDTSRIDQFAELMADGVSFPPVVVFREGSTYRLADGFHRVEAAKKLGRTEILVEIRHGSRSDALHYAAQANATAALPLSDADKRRVVTLMLQDPESQSWSDVRVARHCGVSNRFVGLIRAELSLNDSTMVRQCLRNGKPLTMNTAGIRKKKVVQPEPPTLAEAAPAGQCFDLLLICSLSATLRKELLAVPMPRHLSPNAVLLFRTSCDDLFDSEQVVRHWGLKPVTVLPWVTPNRRGTDFGADAFVWLVAEQGRPEYSLRGYDSGVVQKNHKDDARVARFFQLLERFYPGPKATLFEPCGRAGWDVIPRQVQREAGTDGPCLNGGCKQTNL